MSDEARDRILRTEKKIARARSVSMQRWGIGIPGEQKALFALMAAAERALKVSGGE